MPTLARLAVLAALSWFAVSPVRAEVVHIGNAETQALLKQGVTIVDIRTPGEWKQTGVVAGSQLVQFVDERGKLDPDAFIKQINEVADPSKPVVLICRSGNRTGKAAQLLAASQPNRKIYNVKEGIVAWGRAGLPIVPLQQNLQSAGIKCTPAC
jgi:rhodanese-related sulfurtransferase